MVTVVTSRLQEPEQHTGTGPGVSGPRTAKASGPNQAGIPAMGFALRVPPGPPLPPPRPQIWAMTVTCQWLSGRTAADRVTVPVPVTVAVGRQESLTDSETGSLDCPDGLHIQGRTYAGERASALASRDSVRVCGMPAGK